MKSVRKKWPGRRFTVVSAAAIIAVCLCFGPLEPGSGAIGHSHTLTQTVVNIDNYNDLLDFCWGVVLVPGVTGVRIVQFDPKNNAATITVFYDPVELPTTQLRILLDNNHILFADPRAT